MNTPVLRVIRNTLLASCCMLVSLTASAADSPHRRALEARSRSTGLGAGQVELLQRVPAAGARTTATRLRQAFAEAGDGIHTRGAATEDERDGQLRLEGEAGWSLTVYGDGSQVRYRNRELHASHRPAVAVGAEPSAAKLEAWGRRFIAEHLAGEIRLGAGERLELLRVAYEREGSQRTADPASRTEAVVGAAVVFTRTLGGVDVVGAGSKVSVFFTTDGQPWGFDYDWPSYERLARPQQVLPVNDIRERARRLGAGTPAGGDAQVAQVRWECGYFDPGVRRRSATAPVQAACVSHEVVNTVGDAARHQADPRDGLLTSARMDVIPAGVTVEADPSWPETLRAP